MKVIKVGAIWCGSCLNMKHIWNDIEKNYNIELLSLDYDIDEEEVEKLNVGNKLPVAIIFDDNGNELERIIGEKKKQEIISIIEKYK